MHRTRLFLFKISTIHVIFFSAGRSHLPTELCRPVQILFLTSYKLNKIFKNIKVVLVKDRKEKKTEFSWISTGSHRMTIRNQEILPLWSLSLCGELSRTEFYQLALHSKSGYQQLTFVSKTGQYCLHEGEILA